MLRLKDSVISLEGGALKLEKNFYAASDRCQNELAFKFECVNRVAITNCHSQALSSVFRHLPHV